jgi:hypothetical protein
MYISLNEKYSENIKYYEYILFLLLGDVHLQVSAVFVVFDGNQPITLKFVVLFLE